MLSLWCIPTGWTGESYERAYAWAETEVDARRLFAEAHGSSGRTAAEAHLLFRADAAPFITPLSDSGFADGENF